MVDRTANKRANVLANEPTNEQDERTTNHGTKTMTTPNVCDDDDDDCGRGYTSPCFYVRRYEQCRNTTKEGKRHRARELSIQSFTLSPIVRTSLRATRHASRQTILLWHTVNTTSSKVKLVNSLSGAPCCCSICLIRLPSSSSSSSYRH